MKASEDPGNEGNSAAYHTGKPCVERGCDRPAGTAWSPQWCFECNVVRMKRISRSLAEIELKFHEMDLAADKARPEGK